MAKQNTPQIGFSLQGIKTESFIIEWENFDLKQKELGLQTQYQFKVDSKNKHIGAYVAFTFRQSEKIFIELVVSCHFKIKADAWNTFATTKGDDIIVVPKGFLAHLAMITIGTARGILFAKTENTPFSSFMIPTIDVVKAISKDGEFGTKK